VWWNQRFSVYRVIVYSWCLNGEFCEQLSTLNNVFFCNYSLVQRKLYISASINLNSNLLNLIHCDCNVLLILVNKFTLLHQFCSISTDSLVFQCRHRSNFCHYGCFMTLRCVLTVWRGCVPSVSTSHVLRRRHRHLCCCCCSCCSCCSCWRQLTTHRPNVAALYVPGLNDSNWILWDW
jgi:hypothetical protein